MRIVEHYTLGAIVGGPTAGTNVNLNAFTLPGGYRVNARINAAIADAGGGPIRRSESAVAFQSRVNASIGAATAPVASGPSGRDILV